MTTKRILGRTRISAANAAQLFVVVGGFSVLAIMGAGKACIDYVEWSTISREEGSVVGRVTEVQRKGEKGQVLRYVFTYGDREYHGTEAGNHYKGESEAGDPVSVRFCRNNPGESTLDLPYLGRSVFVTSVLSAICAGMATLFAIAFRKKFSLDKEPTANSARVG